MHIIYNIRACACHIGMCMLLFFCFSANAQNIEYMKEDSTQVEALLLAARMDLGEEHPMVWFGKRFLGKPYVAHTLENGTAEHLIVNLREFDCTTFVETVLALTLCHKNNQSSFADFCNNLRLIRYRGGVIDGYCSRLHYFTWWGEDNERMGIAEEVSSDGVPFSQIQTININYMSAHPDLYKHLKGNPQRIAAISKLEQATNGKRVRFIPKSQTAGSPSGPLGVVHDGDILATTTSKPGLDTSHIGIAVWLEGKLYMLNASSLHHHVVLPAQTLFQYQQQQKSQTGIRVWRVK